MAKKVIDLQNEFSFLGKRYRLPSGKVQSVSVNGQTKTPDSQGNVDLGNVQGEPGPKGDTGNVQVDGNGNVLIVNSLTEGGTGAALSAEMGKRLAMLNGTFAAAWIHSKVVPTTFCWLWTETIGGSPVCKPIWHIGNSAFVDAVGAVVSVDASPSLPATPTMTINGSPATSGGSYGKNSELVITPATDSALYWRIGSGSWSVSDSAVTVTLPSGSLAIEAYCTNQAGNSQTASVNVTVAGTATPSFAAATGTTINNGVVSRGGSVVVSVPQGGELHYRINGGSWTTASGLSVSIPIATNLNQGQMVIEAYNVEDSDESTHVTNTYTMAALDAPVFSPASGELPSGGGTVELSAATGANIFYNLTTDGTDPADPTDASTQYMGGTPISVSVATKIKAIAKDAYGTSAVASASYTVAIPAVKISATQATTVTINGNQYNLNAGETSLPLSTVDSGGNNEISSFAFDSIGLITSIDWGGATYTGTALSMKDAVNLVSFTNFITTSSLTSICFENCKALANLDFSGFAATTATGTIAMFKSCEVLEEIDISWLTFRSSGHSFFRDCKALDTLKLGDFAPNNITAIFNGTTTVKTLEIHKSDAVLTVNSSTDWFAALKGQSTGISAIKVPSSLLSNYLADTYWSSQNITISAYDA